MQLNELKKSMSTLEQVLAKTNSDIKINVSTSQTAKTKILKKIRQGFVSCIILAIVFTAMALGNVEPQSFPNYLKIGMACCWGGLVHLCVSPTKPYRCGVSLSGQSVFQDGEHKADDDFRRGILHGLSRHIFHTSFPIFLEL